MPSSTRPSKAWCCSPSTRAKCTCPSRALIQESIYDKFIEKVLKRVAAIKGSPLDTDTMMGAQASDVQMEKIQSYLKLGKEEGAECLIGGERAHLGGDIEGGYYIQPTSSRATTRCASSRKRSSGRCWP
jgi:acyl-CoA reductase-like NAD-dependent aldehyde dehydrogenase